MLQDEQDRLSDEYIGCRKSRIGFKTSIYLCRLQDKLDWLHDKRLYMGNVKQNSTLPVGAT